MRKSVSSFAGGELNFLELGSDSVSFNGDPKPTQPNWNNVYILVRRLKLKDKPIIYVNNYI